MLAIGIIYSVNGSFEFGVLPAPAAFLIWVAVMAKASLFPFVWLEDSSYSPAPLAALIQFASSSGIFLITKFSPDFLFIKSGIAFFGIISIAISFFKGFSEDNIKRILAYSTIAASGLLFTVFDLPYANNIFIIISLARTAYLLMAKDFADQFLYGTDLGLNTKTIAGFASTLCLLSIAGFPNFGIYLIGEGKIFQAIMIAVLSGIYLGNMQAKVFGGDVPVKKGLSTYFGVLLVLASVIFYPLSEPRAVDFFTVLALVAVGFLLLRIKLLVKAIEFISERLRVHFPNISSEQDLIEDWSYSFEEFSSKIAEKAHGLMTGSTGRDIAYIAVSIILLVIGVKLC
jgi:formate hydrogenlyase subunit 3/multisubunit Na+/H+ antiporter MnhD subunit